jgi:hypothetical protein
MFEWQYTSKLSREVAGKGDEPQSGRNKTERRICLAA